MADDHIVVRCGKVPGQIKEIALNGGRTVADALDACEIDDDGEIRVNGEPATLETGLRQGDTVLLLHKVKGA